MKYDWLIEQRGVHHYVTLRLQHNGLQYSSQSVLHKDEWGNKLYRDNTLTMMIDDLFRHIGRNTIQLPKEASIG